MTLSKAQLIDVTIAFGPICYGKTIHSVRPLAAIMNQAQKGGTRPLLALKTHGITVTGQVEGRLLILLLGLVLSRLNRDPTPLSNVILASSDKASLLSGGATTHPLHSPQNLCLWEAERSAEA